MAPTDPLPSNDYFDLSRPLQHAATGEELPGISAENRAHVKAAADRLLGAITPWANGYPIVSKKRLLAACLAAVVTFPDGGQDLQALIARFYLGLWALDDVIDQVLASDYSDSQRTAILHVLALVTATPEGGLHADPALLDMLQPIRGEEPWLQATMMHELFCRTLQRFPGATAYYPAFAQRFSAMLRSWTVEERWKQEARTTQRVPTFAAYLANGRESVIHAAILVAFLVMQPPQPAEPWASLEARVEAVLIPASTAIRLANDLRSYPRDLAEGKPTSLQLIMQERSVAEGEGERILLSLIEEQRHTLQAAVAALPACLTAWGAAVQRITGFGVEFYLRREFHQFDRQDLQDMAGPDQPQP